MKRRTRRSPIFVHAPVCASVDAQEAFATAFKAQQDMLPELITKAVTEAESAMPDDATVKAHSKLDVVNNKYEYRWKGRLMFTCGIIAQAEEMDRTAGGVN